MHADGRPALRCGNAWASLPAVLLAVGACGGAGAGNPWDLAPTPAPALPTTLRPAPPLPETGAGEGCVSSLEDPATGVRFILTRSVAPPHAPAPLGDYRPEPEGAFALSSAQLVRVDCRTGRVLGTVGPAGTSPAPAADPERPASGYVTVGLFIASIEEGARIFTPVRLLPREHPEALGHDFPTVLQFHAGEDRLLVHLGDAAGLGLRTTLQRYPVEPDTTWPYLGFARPPVDRFANLTARRQPARAAPLPGLRAVAFLDRFPIAFIVDTRGMSLDARGMTRATSSGLDVTREALLRAMATASSSGPSTGPWMLIYQPD